MRRPGGRGGGGRGGGGRGGEGGEFWGRGRGGLDGRVVHGGFPSAHGNGGRGVQGGEGGVTRPPTRICRTHNTNFLSLRMYPHWTLTTLTSTMDINSSYYFICLVQSHAV